MSEVRNFKLSTIWASAAETTIPDTPVTGTAYRNETAVFTDGWKYLTKAPTDVSNQLLYMLSKSIDQIQTYGTLGWNSSTTYPAEALCWGSDGRIYISQQSANTGHDPDGDDGTWWVSLTAYTSNALKNKDGWENRQNGLQERWGIIYNGGTEYTHNVQYTKNFVTPFSNECFQIQLTQYTPITSYVSQHSIPTLISSTVTGFTWWPQNDNCQGVIYRAIGH